MFNIIYNPVEPPEKIETNHAVEMQWGGQSPRVLSVGTLKDQKNHKVLLDAFAKLPNRSARLIIVGEGPLRGELKRHASQLGIADRLIMPGSVDPWPYYASANLFVLSSDYEGFGNVIVEAMYAGLPVVSTDCPSGPAEILGGGKYGRLVPVGDAGRLSEAIEQALTDAPDPDANRARAKELSGESAVRAYRDLLVDPKVHSQ
jgi:glycosyltransferase involved in cell wall biosynthesis